MDYLKKMEAAIVLQLMEISLSHEYSTIRRHHAVRVSGALWPEAGRKGLPEVQPPGV